MKRPLFLVLCGLPMLAACGGTGASSIVAADGGGTTVSIGDAGAASTVTENGGSASFDFAKVYLTRDGAWCGSPPPFTSGDEYSLVLEAAGPLPAQTVQIGARATTPVGIAETLTVRPWKAGPPLTQGDNDIDSEDATLNDAKGNELGAFSLLRGLTPSVPDPNPYDQATLTVLSMPQKEGDTFAVRIQLHFTDGKTLDETFASPLVEEETACAGEAE